MRREPRSPVAWPVPARLPLGPSFLASAWHPRISSPGGGTGAFSVNQYCRLPRPTWVWGPNQGARGCVGHSQKGDAGHCGSRERPSRKMSVD